MARARERVATTALRSGFGAARYVVLLGIGLVAIVVVGVTSYGAVTSIRTGIARVTAVDRISVTQQDANIAVHGVYGHVLAAVSAGRSGEGHYLEETTEHAERAVADLADNEARARHSLAHESELAGELAEVSKHVRAFTVQAQQLARLARTDPAAARVGLHEFEESFEALDAQLDTVSDSLSEAADPIHADAQRRIGLAIIMILTAIGTATVLMVGLGAMVFRTDLRATRSARRQANRHQFAAQLHTALEMVSTEEETYDVLARAMSLAAADQPTELLLADSSHATLTKASATPGEGPCCPISSPWECVAVRRGQRVVFDDSEGLSACPKLRGRPSGPVSAVCVPVTFMGRGLGVLHSTATNGTAPELDVVERLTTVADQLGNRIGTLRAFSRSELRAATDGLTGLLNRRSLEDQIRQRISTSAEYYAVAIGDLDQFKQLNDLYGHDAGDRALRLFATTVKQALRAEDIAGRYGGEEFVVLLPGLSAEQATAVMHRLHEQLAEATASGAVPAFTVSFGVADSTEAVDYPDVLALADLRLRRAKQQGRNRTIATDDTEAPPAASGSNPWPAINTHRAEHANGPSVDAGSHRQHHG